MFEPIIKIEKIEDMPNPIKTDISVLDLNLFRIFLDANDMKSYSLGYYAELDPHSPWPPGVVSENKICYNVNMPSFITESNEIYMKMKFGSLTNAFKEFKKDLHNRKTFP